MHDRHERVSIVITVQFGNVMSAFVSKCEGMSVHATHRFAIRPTGGGAAALLPCRHHIVCGVLAGLFPPGDSRSGGN